MTVRNYPSSLSSNGPSVPTEILVLIIPYLTLPKSFGSILIDGNSLLAFSLVSRHWRISALSLTIAWRDLDIVWPRDRLQLWISRAGIHPLRCHFKDERGYSYPHLALNLPRAARLGLPIQLVSFTVSEPRLVPTILSALETGLMDSVTIEVDNSTPSSHGVFIPGEILARVEVLALRNVRELKHLKTSLPRLKSLHLCNRPHDKPFPHVFKFTPSLVRLAMSDLTPRQFVPRARMLRPVLSPFAERCPPLLRLETLCIGAPGYSAMLLAHEVALPQLRNLIIADPSPHAPTVCQLSTACLTIRSLRVNSKHASSILDALFPVSTDLADSDSASSAYDTLPHDTLPLFPALEELQISSIPPPFNIYDTPNEKEPSIATDSLQFLRAILRFEGSLHNFLVERAGVGYPRLKRLHIQASASSDESAAIAAAATAWLSEAAEEVTIDLSPAWDLVESAGEE